MPDMRLVVEILGEDRASGPLQNVSTHVRALGSASEAAGGPMARVGSLLATGLGIGSGIALFNLGKQAIAGMFAAVEEAENTSKQLETVLKSTGGAAGVTAQAAQDLASSLQMVTRYDDEAVLATENLLLTFRDVKSDNFARATEDILDMSAALGQDLKSSAIQLGKALEDPEKGVTALRRVGVMLTDQQKEQISTMVAAGDAAGAQRVILQELEMEFGNSAKAAGETFGGQLDILGHKMEEVEEKAGKRLIPRLLQVVDVASDFVDAMDKANSQNFYTPPGPVTLGGVAGGAVAHVTDILTGVVGAPVTAAENWLQAFRHIVLGQREALVQSSEGQEAREEYLRVQSRHAVATEVGAWTALTVEDQQKVIAESEKLQATLGDEDDAFTRHVRSLQINAPIAAAMFQQEMDAAKELGRALSNLGASASDSALSGLLGGGKGVGDALGTAIGKAGRGLADEGDRAAAQAQRQAEKDQREADKAAREADQARELAFRQGIGGERLSLANEDLRRQIHDLQPAKDKAALENEVLDIERERISTQIDLQQAQHDGDQAAITALTERIHLYDLEIDRVRQLGIEKAKETTKGGSIFSLYRGALVNDPYHLYGGAPTVPAAPAAEPFHWPAGWGPNAAPGGLGGAPTIQGDVHIHVQNAASDEVLGELNNALKRLRHSPPALAPA